MKTKNENGTQKLQKNKIKPGERKKRSYHAPCAKRLCLIQLTHLRHLNQACQDSPVLMAPAPPTTTQSAQPGHRFTSTLNV